MQVYLDKIGEIDESEPGEAAYWGVALEEIVAKEFTARSGHKVHRVNYILPHPEHPWMLANIDRTLTGKNEGLECKTASAYLSQEWDDDAVPPAYWCQCQWYMAITGADGWWVAVLIGGQKFQHKRIPRDNEAIKNLIEIGRNFWENNVVARVMPDPESADADSLHLAYPLLDLEPANLDFGTLLAEYDEAKKLEKVGIDRRKGVEAQIKAITGAHIKAVDITSGRTVSWSYTTDKNLLTLGRLQRDNYQMTEKYTDRKPYRKLSISKIKKEK